VIPICARARVIVANDTGTAHLASATGRPMVVICGPTDPRRVKPLGDNVDAFQAELPCINCYRKHCAHHSCMRLITPAMVEAKVKSMLAPG
jgi:heptosyltransferase-2